MPRPRSNTLSPCSLRPDDGQVPPAAPAAPGARAPFARPAPAPRAQRPPRALRPRRALLRPSRARAPARPPLRRPGAARPVPLAQARPPPPPIWKPVTAPRSADDGAVVVGRLRVSVDGWSSRERGTILRPASALRPDAAAPRQSAGAEALAMPPPPPARRSPAPSGRRPPELLLLTAGGASLPRLRHFADLPSSRPPSIARCFELATPAPPVLLTPCSASQVVLGGAGVRPRGAVEAGSSGCRGRSVPGGGRRSRFPALLFGQPPHAEGSGQGVGGHRDHQVPGPGRRPAALIAPERCAGDRSRSTALLSPPPPASPTLR
jgi:hypothetical protein